MSAPAIAGALAVLDDAPVAAAFVGTLPGHDEPLLAVTGASGRLLLVSLRGRVAFDGEIPAGLLTLAPSPSGAALALGGPEGAWVWTALHGLRKLPVDGWCAALAWTADGRLAVAAGREVAAFDLDVLTGETARQPSWRTAPAPSTVTAVRWLRDGRELAVAAYGGVRVFDRRRPGPVRELAYAGSLLSVDVPAGGRWLVSGNQDASIHVWRLRDGHEFEMAGFPRKVTSVAFDSSGRWLAADGAPESTVWDFSGSGPGGTAPRLLSAHDAGPRAAAWHPHAPFLATGGDDGLLAVWDVPRCPVGRAAPPEWSARPVTAAIGALTWSPDGRHLMVAAEDGTIFATTNDLWLPPYGRRPRRTPQVDRERTTS